MGDGLKRALGSAMQSNLPVQVKVGQIWQDNDPRLTYIRRLKVLEIVGEKAIVQHTSGLGPKTKIRLNRFRPTSTGYKLVSE